MPKSSLTSATPPPGSGTPPWLVPSLDADLREAGGVCAGEPIELAPVAVEIGAQLLLGRVLLADLADLTADADDDAVALRFADERRDLRRALIVDALLLVDRRQRQVDERRRVDVDVAVADRDRLAGQALRIASVVPSASAAYFLALNW